MVRRQSGNHYRRNSIASDAAAQQKIFPAQTNPEFLRVFQPPRTSRNGHPSSLKRHTAFVVDRAVRRLERRGRAIRAPNALLEWDAGLYGNGAQIFDDGQNERDAV